MDIRPHVSSARDGDKGKDTYGTPQSLYDCLDAEFEFDLDPCAAPETAKCFAFYTEGDDGLSKDWTDHTVFMNPPYSKIERWMEKAFESSLCGNTTVVCLVPARTATKWWHRWAMNADEIRFIEGRITFQGVPTPAPFPSAIVVFGGEFVGPPKLSAMKRPEGA